MPLSSKPQLVLIYRSRRDERLSRPWCEVAQAEIRTRILPIANLALYHTATSALLVYMSDSGVVFCHVQEKPHKCSLCSKSFPTPGDLKSHMYVHSGSWPYKCDLCSRGFSKQANLKNHLLLHTGPSSFIVFSRSCLQLLHLCT